MLYDFINPTEIASLPSEPSHAFSQFAHITSRRLQEKIDDLTERDASWQLVRDLRYDYMNIVVAASKRYKITPLMELQMPQHDEFQDENYRQFSTDLDHYLTQLLLSDPESASENSIYITNSYKENVLKYLNAIKSEVEKSDLPENEQSKLLAKIYEIEDILNRRKISMFTVVMTVMAFLSFPGGAFASYDIVKKLAHNIIEETARENYSQSQNSIANQVEEIKLIPPRKDMCLPSEKRVSSYKNDLDDEIPF